jgi:hypothetical protein
MRRATTQVTDPAGNSAGASNRRRAQMPGAFHHGLLGFAVAATALVAAGSSTARGQSPAAQTEEPSRPSASSAADEDTSRHRLREPPGTIVRSLSLFDHGLANDTKPTVALESWQSGVEMKCIGCRGFETTGVRPESVNANAPWALQGKWRRQTTLGVVSTGFVGVRNYALPLSSAIPLGGDLDPAALGTAGESAFLPGSQWSLTAGVEKTLAKSASGASFGVTADLLIPVKNEAVAGDPRNTVRTSPTLRFGGVLRW